MRVLFTGQSGLGKKRLIQEVRESAESKKRKVLYFSVGDMMYGVKPEVKRGKMLEQPLDQIESRRARVFDKIQTQLSQKPDHDVFVDTHATFRWPEGEGLFAAFTVGEIAEFRPDLCIAVVADVDEIKARLAESDFPLKHLTLRDIMIWREEELVVSELMADLVPYCRYYMVPRNMGHESVERLVFDPEALKCYLSFPITPPLSPRVQDQVNHFREAFKKLPSIAVFDPLAGTAEPKLISKMNKILKDNPAAETMKVESLGQTIELKISELKEIERHIDHYVQAFDLRLVAQTDATIALFPEQEGKSYAAPGVVIELAYARHRGRDRYLVWPGPDKPTLMLSPYTEKFDSIDQAADFFRNRSYLGKP